MNSVRFAIELLIWTHNNSATKHLTEFGIHDTGKFIRMSKIRYSKILDANRPLFKTDQHL